MQKSPREIGSELEQFRKDAVLLEDKIPGLLKSHPMQWAGVFRGELKIASTQDELIALFGDDSPKTAMRLLHPNPPPFILATRHTEAEEDRLEQQRIRSRANRSISVLEKGFIYGASGRYFVLSARPGRP